MSDANGQNRSARNAMPMVFNCAQVLTRIGFYPPRSRRHAWPTSATPGEIRCGGHVGAFPRGHRHSERSPHVGENVHNSSHPTRTRSGCAVGAILVFNVLSLPEGR
jgi:hypothetical protein